MDDGICKIVRAGIFATVTYAEDGRIRVAKVDARWSAQQIAGFLKLGGGAADRGEAGEESGNGGGDAGGAAEGPPAGENAGGEKDGYPANTVKALRAAARELKIPGYGRMTCETLLRAVRDAKGRN